VPEAPSLRNCLLFITILLVILVFSEIRENKGFRHRRRRQSISWIRLLHFVFDVLADFFRKFLRKSETVPA
jgi:hypothetical protein